MYLDKKGRKALRFKDNYPSRDWAQRYTKRHPELTNRMCQNIKRSKAAVSPAVFHEYFENLKITLQDMNGEFIQPENIFNYDETNLSDDPGTKLCIFKRRVKYAERIKDSSKSSISVMFCGSASGHVLPPYVVYKAEHLWQSWIDGGPPHTRYNRSKSGWFDSVIFNDWFVNLFVPYVKRMHNEGKVVLIGDNLSSHFTEEVLKICSANNICFVCLPPNSTSLAQPLDVAFFGPLKKYWRSILDKWKSGLRKKSQTITKEAFPGLLKQLCEKVLDLNNVSTNLVSGFKKCGIYPFNPEEIISRLPDHVVANESETNEINNVVSEVVVDMLKDLRYGSDSNSKKRRTKVNVVPGRSIGLEDLNASTSNQGNKENIVSNSNDNQSINSLDIGKVQNSERPDSDVESNSSILSVPSTQYERAEHQKCDFTEQKCIELSSYVLIRFEVPKNKCKYYIGTIVEIDKKKDYYKIKCLRKKNKKFIWPKLTETIVILPTQIVKVLSAPQSTKMGFNFNAQELINFKIE